MPRGEAHGLPVAVSVIRVPSPEGPAYAAACTVHGFTALYLTDSGAALGCIGHATTFHGPPTTG